RREPCTKPSRHPRHTAFFSAWNFIIRRNMRAGSTWLKSRSAYCAVNVWIAELASVKSSSPRSTRGIGDATSLARGSNGSSPRKRHGTSWHVPIRTWPKSRNHCAEVLDAARRLVELMYSDDDRVALMGAEKVMVWS